MPVQENLAYVARSGCASHLSRIRRRRPHLSAETRYPYLFPRPL